MSTRINEYLFHLQSPDSKEEVYYRAYVRTLEDAWVSINERSLYKDWTPTFVRAYEI